MEPEAEAAGGFRMLICTPSKQRRGSEGSRVMAWMPEEEGRVTDLGV